MLPLVIWKWRLPMDKSFHLSMPAGALLQSIGIQDGAAVIWAMVNPAAPKRLRKFVWVFTGEIVQDPNARFFGTLNCGSEGESGLVYHLLDQGETL